MALGGLVTKEIASVAVTAGTPAVVWTPASGKKFRLLGYRLGVTVAAAAIIFKEGVANALIGIRTPVLAVNAAHGGRQSIGNGVLSAAADNVLKVDVSVSATVTGFLWGFEE